MSDRINDYAGIEIGPIRPPSEAESLLIRVTRNCPWNKCKFCGLYKNTKFTIRKKEHVLEDIDQIRKCIEIIRYLLEFDAKERQAKFREIMAALNENERTAFSAAVNWYNSGMRSVFLQDANSMIIKPKDMLDILGHIKKSFPQVERITSYARSDAIARISDEDLRQMAAAGLNRIHIGMESASDKVLQLVQKGVDKKTHILAGQKVKRAGIELSEYVMPGLGGTELSEEHALETADALNQINPDFIRIRTFALLDTVPLAQDYREGVCTRVNDTKTIEELKLLIENLEGITSYLASDHILNLLPEVEGYFPQDKGKMLAVLNSYLDLNKRDKLIFRLGRRMGLIQTMRDFADESRKKRVETLIEQYEITEENADDVISDIMKGFV